MPLLRTPQLVPVVVGLLVASCGLGNKSADAERIADSAQETAYGDLVSGTVTVELEVDGRDIVDPALLNLPGSVDARFVLRDGASEQLLIPALADAASGPETDSGFPTMVFADGRVDILQSRADLARPWVELDFEDLERNASPISADSFGPGTARAVLAVLGPRFPLEMASGVLSGSVEHDGSEEIAGRRVDRYRANFDVPRAIQMADDFYNEQARQHLDRRLDFIGLDGDVHPGMVWIDATSGRIARFRLELTLDVERLVELPTTVTVDVDADPVPDDRLAIPPVESVTFVGSYFEVARVAASTAPDRPATSPAAIPNLGPEDGDG